MKLIPSLLLYAILELTISEYVIDYHKCSEENFLCFGVDLKDFKPSFSTETVGCLTENVHIHDEEDPAAQILNYGCHILMVAELKSEEGKVEWILRTPVKAAFDINFWITDKDPKDTMGRDMDHNSISMECGHSGICKMYQKYLTCDETYKHLVEKKNMSDTNRTKKDLSMGTLLKEKVKTHFPRTAFDFERAEDMSTGFEPPFDEFAYFFFTSGVKFYDCDGLIFDLTQDRLYLNFEFFSGFSLFSRQVIGIHEHIYSNIPTLIFTEKKFENESQAYEYEEPYPIHPLTNSDWKDLDIEFLNGEDEDASHDLNMIDKSIKALPHKSSTTDDSPNGKTIIIVLACVTGWLIIMTLIIILRRGTSGMRMLFERMP